MRLGGRLSAAIEVLEDIESRHRPVAAALKDWGLSHRFAGSGDRAAIGNIVYDALRRRSSIAHRMGSDAPRAVAFGVLFEWGLDADRITAQLLGDRFAPEGLDDLAAQAGSGGPGNAPDHVRADVPEWISSHLAGAFGADWVAEARGLSDRPPLDLRVNRLKVAPEKVLKALARAGAVRGTLAPVALRIASTHADRRHPNVQAEPAFRKGWFEIQDEGSQIAALLAGAGPGMQVLDYCAGAGGKTLALSAEMQNRGQIFAHDADKNRLAPIFERLKRAGSRNVQAFGDAEPLDDLTGRMDLVLVDAPCTGSGTWRRRPDAKWRLSAEQLQQRVGEQAAILDQASGFVKPGGRLVYVTCSVFPEENDHRIAAFCQTRPEFEPTDHAALWADFAPEKGDAVRISENGVALTPARSGTDGFYVSVMKRRTQPG